jgi:hypothetical protein
MTKGTSMKTTADFLDDLKKKFNTDSDAAAARAIGVNHRQQVSRWRQMHSTFDDELCLKIADTLDVDPTYVVACMHHQREKNQALKKIWSRIAKHYAVTATVVMAVTLTFVTLDSSIPSLPVLGDVSRSFDITKIMQSEIYIIRICQAFAAFIIAALCSTPKGRNDTTPA